MLLADYLDQCDNVAPSVPRRVYIIAGATFEFGERYSIIDHKGVTLDIPVLDDILSIMRDEMIAERALPRIGMSDLVAQRVRDGAKQRYRQLVVSGTAAGYSNEGVEAKVEQVRQAVTMYNLTGEWTMFAKDNL